MTSQSTDKPKKVDFFIRPFRETLTIIKFKLSGATCRLLEFMSACCTFAGEVVYMPSAKQIAEILDMGLSTVYYCFDRIKQFCPFIQFQTNSAFVLAYRVDPDNPQKILDFKNLETLPKQKNQFQKFRNVSNSLENQELEAIAQGEHSPPQTSQISHTPQTGDGDEKKVNTENGMRSRSRIPCSNVKTGCALAPVSRDEIEEPSKEKKLDKKFNVKENVPATVVQKALSIPQDLLEKLKELEIEPTEQVMQAIKKHHISQAYSAAAHIENTWVTIRNPRKVFLYQLPKQPIEKMGMRSGGTEAIEKAKQESHAIELERQTPEYEAGWQEMKAKIDRLLGRQKK